MVPLLTIDLRVTDQVGIQGAVSVPDVTRSALVPRPNGPVNFSETFSGLGDTSVVGWYRLVPMNQWYVVTTFGASVPTGKTETPRFRSDLVDGSLVPTSRLQRGSGTFDPLVGASVTRKFRGLGTVFGSVAARLPIYENREGLRTGASSELNTGIARDVFTTRISAFGRLGWLRRSQDEFRGTKILVGGGHWIYLSPGIAAQVGKGINVQAEVKIPVHRSLANKQLDSAAIFQFGVSRSF